MLFSYGLVDVKIVDAELMYLRSVPFRWPCGHAHATPSALPDGRGSGLHQKSLDSNIGWVFAPYCPGGHHVDSKQNNDDKIHQLCWPFCWLWRCTGTILLASLNGGGSGLQWKPLIDATGQVLRPIIAIGQRYVVFSEFFSSSTHWKGALGDFKVPNINRGMTYQSYGKELSKRMWYLGWGA